MVVKKHILKTLDRLDTHFSEAMRSSSPEDSIYFSKLAILEYCGWIEETFDQIVKRSVKGKIKTPEFEQMLKSMIESNSGFQYKQHFRSMLIKAIGLKSMEKIEICLKEAGQLDILISELETVKSHRNSAAHTRITGATSTYPAPSYTKARFEIVYPIMKSIYSKVIRL